jgi:hypothetical protein
VQIEQMLRDVLSLLSETGQQLDASARALAQATLERLKAVGYCEKCAPAALGELLRERYG